MNSRKCYVILETVRDTDRGYIPCIVVEGETGYYRTDWNWGPDKEQTEEIAAELNAAMGISEREAYDLVLASMRKE